MATDAQLRTAQRALDKAVANRQKAEAALAVAKNVEFAAQAKLDALVHPALAVPKAVPSWESNFTRDGAAAFAPWHQWHQWDAQNDDDPRGWIRRCQNEGHPIETPWRLLQPDEIGALAQHLQIYVGGMSAKGVPDPVSFSPTGMKFTARKNADALKPILWGWTGRWTSAMGDLANVFEQRLGHWEVRCRWSGGWGGFWGIPLIFNGQEIDVLEAVNAKRGITTSAGHGLKVGTYASVGPAIGNITSGAWTIISMDWTETELIPKVNGVETGRLSLAGMDMSRPCYPILTLEIGAGRSWPDQTEPTEDEVWIEYDYVRVSKA